MDLAPTSFAQPDNPIPHRRIGPRLLLTLLAGRSMFRVVLYGANLFLLGAWGHRVFARYAAACGAAIWITALAQSGPEKAALKLIPRARRSRHAIVAALLVTVRSAVIVAGLVAAIAITLDRQATATLYIAEAAESVAIGVNAVAVGVRRSLGQPGYDTVNFALLSAGWILITAVAVVAHINPALYVFAQLVLAVAITEVTLRGLRPPARAIVCRPRILRILAGTIGFIGMYDVVACASASAAFLVLRVTHFANQSGDLYVAVAGWAIVFSLVTYVLRVFQPQISLRLAAGGQRTGTQRARSLVQLSLAVNIAWLAAAGSLIVILNLRSLPEGRTYVVALVALVASQTPVFMLTAVGVCLLENLNGRSLRAVGAATGGGFVVVIVTSLVVIPFYGAAGAIWALATMELVQAIVLLRGPAAAKSHQDPRRSGVTTRIGPPSLQNPIELRHQRTNELKEGVA
jgi:hypothetical protein